MRRRATRTRRHALATLVAAVAVLAGPASPARAHDGPPYAVLVDHPLGERRLEVWTDPDIGTGSYWIVLSPAVEGGPLTPPDEVSIRVVACDGSHPEVGATASREQADALQYYAEVPFAEGGWWTTRVLVRDGDERLEAAVDVEVTPPGVGPISFAIYLFPFVAFGLIFLKLALKRRRLAAAARPPGGSQQPPARDTLGSVT